MQFLDKASVAQEANGHGTKAPPPAAGNEAAPAADEIGDKIPF